MTDPNTIPASTPAVPTAYDRTFIPYPLGLDPKFERCLPDTEAQEGVPWASGPMPAGASSASADMQNGVMRRLPVIFYPGMQLAVWDVICSGEIFKYHPIPVMDNKNIISSCSRLLMRSFPLAVVGIVSQINVLAAKGLSFRAFPHGAKEIAKICNPLLAHSYSASAIVSKLWIARVKASAFSVGPRFVSSGSLIVYGMSVLKASISDGLNSQASTTSVSAFKVFEDHQPLGPTIAFNFPKRSSANSAGTPNCDKQTKSLIGYINCFHRFSHSLKNANYNMVQL